MKAQRVFPAPAMAFLCVLLFSALSSPQRPDLPGKISVSSTPPGAAIRIDNQRMRQSTGSKDVVFTVSPGEHSVALIHPDLPKCAKPIKSNVNPGSVTHVSCTAAGWAEPAYR